MASNNSLSLAPRVSFRQAAAITLLVGPDEEPLIAHGAKLTSLEFFVTAMKKEWVEGQTRTIKLPEEVPDEMAHYLGWTYSGRLPTCICDGLRLPSGEGENDVYNLLAKLYLLGERVLDVPFRNEIIAEILRLMDLKDEEGMAYGPDTTAANIIYPGTPKDSPARRFLVEMTVRFGQPDWALSDLNREFLVDFMPAILGQLHQGGDGREWRRIELRTEDYFV